jgi:outer membrane protein assembly factor BamA
MKTKLLLLLATGSLALSLPALAETNNSGDDLNWSHHWYIGGGINGDVQSHMNLNGSPEVFAHVLDPYDLTSVKQSSFNVGFDIYIGRNIGEHWAAELGYTYVPTTTFDGKQGENELVDVRIDQWNVHLVGIGKIQMAEYVNIFAKGGATYFGSNQTIETESTDLSVVDSIRTLALTYGIGAEITWPHWGIRGEYNVIWPASNVLDDYYVEDIMSANLYYKF